MPNGFNVVSAISYQLDQIFQYTRFAVQKSIFKEYQRSLSIKSDISSQNSASMVTFFFILEKDETISPCGGCFLMSNQVIKFGHKRDQSFGRALERKYWGFDPKFQSSWVSEGIVKNLSSSNADLSSLSPSQAPSLVSKSDILTRTSSPSSIDSIDLNSKKTSKKKDGRLYSKDKLEKIKKYGRRVIIFEDLKNKLRALKKLLKHTKKLLTEEKTLIKKKINFLKFYEELESILDEAPEKTDKKFIQMSISTLKKRLQK